MITRLHGRVRRGLTLAALISAPAGFWGCGGSESRETTPDEGLPGDQGPPTDRGPENDLGPGPDMEGPTPDPRTWSAPGAALEVALLSIGGTSPTDVWAAGADGGQGGVLLHFDGTSWTRVPTGQNYDLWWVHALAADRIIVGGAGGTVLFWDGATFTRQVVPGRAADTVFGVWAASADDVWAVGGRAGRYGFLWHFDGTSWTSVSLPDDTRLNAAGELPALFKVWGRASNDVYAVGSDGYMLHYDGAAWSIIPTETTETLFTVHGNGDEVLAVGAQGSVLDAAGHKVGPEGTPLLQGVHVTAAGEAWLTGANGAVYRRAKGGTFEKQSLGLEVRPESLHAVWADPTGDVWTVGGGVLSPALDQGALFHLGVSEVTLPTVEPFVPPVPGPVMCPMGRADIKPDGSIARRWNELLLDSIRRDIPKPGLHARNLFHTSVALYDAWAAYDATADGYLNTERAVADDVEAARQTAISHAAYRVLKHRYANANGGPVDVACYDDFMAALGLDPTDQSTEGDAPAAVGNRIGQAVIDTFLEDGANEAAMYADTTEYAATNTPLVVDRAGAGCEDPNLWQELNLAQGETQNGIIVPGKQNYIGPNWGFVRAFALPVDENLDGVHYDVDVVPRMDSPEMNAWVNEVIRKTADLEPTAGVDMDISPGAYGNNPLGTNDGTGHAMNPVTGQPYASNVVARGDFTRVLAEFWADGPKSETPPGHWNTLANTASDELAELRVWGEGEAVARLEWDAKLYLALNGSVHDAAITAWGIKRKYLGPRPLTLIRFKAELGQSTEAELPGYHPDGLALEEGLVELITAESSAAGERHHHLRWWQGEVAIRSWLGEPGDRKNQLGGVGWMRAKDWIPYQRRTFVTPAFPGLISGHSTFSRAAAETLTRFTGSPYFPGGLGEFVAPAGNYLVFEDGPSVDVHLQWATYYDAADQAGQSRIWGGIHIWPDDSQGRQLGEQVGAGAATLARTYFDGAAVP